MDVIKGLLRRLSWSLVLYWGVLIGLVWLFIEFTDEIYEEGGFFFDEPVLNWFYTLINPTLTDIMLFFSTVGGVEVMIGASVLVTLFLWRISHREALFFFFCMGGASLVMVLTKFVLNRPRPELFPDVDYWQTHSPSFPSGHATGSMAFALSVYLVTAHLAPKWRPLAAIVGVLFVGWVCASRLYLQVHYPSDILAGLALSAGWVLGVTALYRYQIRDRSHRTVLLTLPDELVKAYRKEAFERGLDEGEVVARALADHYPDVTPASSEPSSSKRSAVADAQANEQRKEHP